MAGRHPFSELEKGWSQERLQQHEEHVAVIAAEWAILEQIRIALGISQEELADLLDVQQPAISKLERRNDMRVSTLRDMIEALGGELKLVAKFRDRTVDLKLAES